jgi:hypothetical protein
VAVTGIVLGGILAALINLGVARFLGTPVPSGFAYAPMYYSCCFTLSVD